LFREVRQLCSTLLQNLLEARVLLEDQSGSPKAQDDPEGLDGPYCLGCWSLGKGGNDGVLRLMPPGSLYLRDKAGKWSLLSSQATLADAEEYMASSGGKWRKRTWNAYQGMRDIPAGSCRD
jgi:hypothetical protein